MTSTSAPSGTFTPFQYPVFRQFWTSALVSNIGVLVQTIGASWVMMTISGSAGMVALVQGMNALPVLFFALASGALADNYDRRLILLTPQTGMLIVSVLLGVFVYFDWITPWLLLAFIFLMGTGSACSYSSWNASVRDTVPLASVPEAVMLNNMGFNATRCVGPALGGTIVATLGVTFSFVCNAVSYIPMIWVLARWKPNIAKQELPREDLFGAMSAGLRYVAMSPSILMVQLRTVLFTSCGVTILALLPVVARDLLGAGPMTYGLLLASFGLGAVLGAVGNVRIRRAMSDEAVIRMACLVFMSSAVALGLSNNVIVSCLALIPAGACWVVAISLRNIAVQLSAPRWVVGRAIALYQMANFGGLTIGSFIWGSVADAYGVSAAVIAGGISLLVCTTVGLRFPMPKIAKLDLDPLDHFKEPKTRLDLQARSGPISITVEYRIHEEDNAEFLKAMTARRRMRIRDGGRRWVLQRDVEDPEIWTESYLFPTWLDYIRHNKRRTKADAELMETLDRLHKGERPQRVRRLIERQTVPPREDLVLKSEAEIH